MAGLQGCMVISWANSHSQFPLPRHGGGSGWRKRAKVVFHRNAASPSQPPPVAGGGLDGLIERYRWSGVALLDQPAPPAAFALAVLAGGLLGADLDDLHRRMLRRRFRCALCGRDRFDRARCFARNRDRLAGRCRSLVVAAARPALAPACLRLGRLLLGRLLLAVGLLARGGGLAAVPGQGRHALRPLLGQLRQLGLIAETWQRLLGIGRLPTVRTRLRLAGLLALRATRPATPATATTAPAAARLAVGAQLFALAARGLRALGLILVFVAIVLRAIGQRGDRSRCGLRTRRGRRRRLLLLVAALALGELVGAELAAPATAPPPAATAALALALRGLLFGLLGRFGFRLLGLFLRRKILRLVLDDRRGWQRARLDLFARVELLDAIQAIFRRGQLVVGLQVDAHATALLHLLDGAALVVEHEQGDRGRHEDGDARAEAARDLFFRHAQHVQRGRLHRPHAAGAVAMRTGLGAGFDQARMQPLARHFQ